MYKDVFPALVPIKMTTYVLERQKQYTPQKTKWFCMWWPRTNALFVSLLNDSSQVLCFVGILLLLEAEVSKTSQVARVVQSLQVATSI